MSKSQLAHVPTAPLAQWVSFDAEMMHVLLKDGRCISVPIIWFPILCAATADQRTKYQIGGGGTSLHWPELDEDLSVTFLLTGPNINSRVKALEATVSYAQSLTQWALLIVAGTALLLVGTEYHRPTSRLLLFSYFLFIPGWISLILSMYRGVRVQQVYLAYLFSERPNWSASMSAVNGDALWQVRTMQFGVLVFGVWLLTYLFYWILFYHMPNEVR